MKNIKKPVCSTWREGGNLDSLDVLFIYILYFFYIFIYIFRYSSSVHKGLWRRQNCFAVLNMDGKDYHCRLHFSRITAARRPFIVQEIPIKTGFQKPLQRSFQPHRRHSCFTRQNFPGHPVRGETRSCRPPRRPVIVVPMAACCYYY